MTAPALSSERRQALNRRSLHLAYATAGYNALEGIVAVAAGAAASSTALLGFGLDSFVEVSSALIVIWQFRARIPEAREARPSPAGIALAAVSVVVMPLLVWAKRRTGRELGSATVMADSTQTLLCTYLSAVLLVGLVLNAALGWSWADPLAALVIAAVAFREGIEAWRGEQCDSCAPGAADGGCADDCCAPTITDSEQG